jgi:hypothetical protein
MFSMFASSAVDCEFEPWSDQTKEDYKIGICCFSASSSKEWEQQLESG